MLLAVQNPVAQCFGFLIADLTWESEALLAAVEPQLFLAYPLLLVLLIAPGIQLMADTTCTTMMSSQEIIYDEMNLTRINPEIIIYDERNSVIISKISEKDQVSMSSKFQVISVRN